MGSVTNPKKPTLESLADQMRRLQERIDDMEDLIELRSAIERNGGKPGVPWEQAKAELDIDRRPRAPGGKFASAHGSPAV